MIGSLNVYALAVVRVKKVVGQGVVVGGLDNNAVGVPVGIKLVGDDRVVGGHQVHAAVAMRIGLVAVKGIIRAAAGDGNSSSAGIGCLID